LYRLNKSSQVNPSKSKSLKPTTSHVPINLTYKIGPLTDFTQTINSQSRRRKESNKAEEKAANPKKPGQDDVNDDDKAQISMIAGAPL